MTKEEWPLNLRYLGHFRDQLLLFHFYGAFAMFKVLWHLSKDASGTASIEEGYLVNADR